MVKARKPEQLIKFYNKIGYLYDLTTKLDLPIYQQILESVDLSHGNCAIEIGCGTGNMTMLLAKYFDKVTGVDVSTGMLQRAKMKIVKANINNVALIEGDFMCMPLEANTYDYSFCVFLLHHLKPDLLVHFMHLVAAVTKHKIIIVDYGRKTTAFYRMYEWFEKSYYKEFVKLNFNNIWQEANLKSEDEFCLGNYYIWILRKI